MFGSCFTATVGCGLGVRVGVATVCTTGAGACERDITVPGTEATVLVVKEEDATVVEV